MINWAEPNITDADIYHTKNVLISGWHTMGKQVKLLEKRMSKISERKYAIAVNNGTSALMLSLKALEIGHGNEVIVPAMSYIASATSVSLVGATPVFVDVDKTMTMNPNLIDDVITKKTKAIISVDLSGSPCNYSLLKEKANIYDIPLVVDGAQSLGSTYKDKPCLSYGKISTTSFHAAKLITTVEGGMCFTDDSDLAYKLRVTRNQGESNIKYVHKVLGGNYRMTDVLASLAVKQLERYESLLARRKEIVGIYKQLLKGVVDFLNVKNSGNFMFIILSERRDEIAQHLKENDIDTRKIYPMTIPQQPIYNDKKSFPISEWFCKRGLSLPLYHKLKQKEIEHICKKIKDVIN